jgi:phage FluMu protein Com
MNEERCSRCGKYQNSGSFPYLEHQFINSSYDWFNDIEVELCESCSKVLYHAIRKALMPTRRMLTISN